MLQNIVIFAACECRRFGAITSSFPFTLSKVASVTFLFFLIQSLLFHSFASPLQKRNHSLVSVYYIALLTYVWCSVQTHTPAAYRKKRRRGSKGGRIKHRHVKIRIALSAKRAITFQNTKSHKVQRKLHVHPYEDIKKEKQWSVAFLVCLAINTRRRITWYIALGQK